MGRRCSLSASDCRRFLHRTTRALSYRDFWTVPQEDVFYKTGAVNAVGVTDIQEVVDGLGLDLSTSDVIDVGCGTGRISALCGEYRGYDIAPSQVEYARSTGLQAELIDGPESLQGLTAGIVLCLSVFTHISRGDRQAYLDVFRSIAPRLLVDILPGAEGGGIPAWYADVEQFEFDLRAAGYEIQSSFVRYPGHHHRYFYAEL